VIVFRVCDSRFPFLWTAGGASWQRPARWHGAGDGPVQYFTDTPSGAWAELLRHEEITDPADLAGISTRLRAAGAVRLVTASAALKPGEAAGFRVGKAGLVRAPRRDGRVIVHFGALPDAEGWCAADAARPDAQLLGHVRPLHTS
jgi:hypothetical protein